MKYLEGLFLFPFAIILAVFLLPNHSFAASSCGNIVVSEFIPNPTGSDADGEWIELHNQSGKEINLAGYVISDTEGSIKKYTIGDVSIAPEGYIIFDRKTTGITLNNDKESVILIVPDASTCQTDFATPDTNANKGLEGQSFAYDDKTKSWKWTTTPTSGQGNVINEPIPDSDEEDETEVGPSNSCTGIMITELMPAPAGSDTENEWIELYNSNTETVDLGGCVLSDKMKTGSTHKYTIPAGTFLESAGYVIFKRPITKITLNNDSDGAMLLSSSGTVVFDTGLYKDAKKNLAYVYANGDWVWTASPTPGEANIISEPPAPVKKASTKKKTTTKAPKVAKTAKNSANSEGEVLGESTDNGENQLGKINDKTLGLILLTVACLGAISYLIYLRREWILTNPIVEKIKNFRK